VLDAFDEFGDRYLSHGLPLLGGDRGPYYRWGQHSVLVVGLWAPHLLLDIALFLF
jgi:hypothetical protein